MSDVSEKQKQEQRKIPKQVIAAIIGAAVLIIAAVIAGLFGAFSGDKMMDITITVTDAQGKPLTAVMSITSQSTGEEYQKTTNDQGVQFLKGLKKGKYRVRARAENGKYEEQIVYFDELDTTLDIKMVKIPDPPPERPFSLRGWNTWGGLNVHNESDNSIALNGRFNDAAGMVSTYISGDMAGKTLILDIANTQSSEYSNNRLLKITVNRSDTLLKPSGITNLVSDEYIPAANGRIEYPIPADFDGKLGFVFYQAALNNLRITAYYRD